MHPNQIRRKRPSFETAHSYFKEGFFSIDPKLHYLSGKEREAEIKKATESLEQVSRQFPRTQNLEYAILKSHLIVEHALVQYIRCFAATFIDVKDLRFSFREKLEIAYLMGFGANHPVLLPTVEALNKIRNQVTHTFALDRSLVDELIRINHEEYKAFNPKNDRQRVQCLRSICTFICGKTAGEIEAAYAIAAITDSERSKHSPV